MLNPQVAIPLAIVVAIPVALVYRWFQHRERLAELATERERPAVDAERMARLEQSVEAIALEVERVGEGQRYLTRVLAEKQVEPGQRAP